MKANYSDAVALKIFKTLYALLGEAHGVEFNVEVYRIDTGERVRDQARSA